MSFGVSRDGPSPADPRRPGQAIVQPGGGPAAQVGADHVVKRRQYLKRDEDHPHQNQRPDQAFPALDRPHKHADDDGERGRQDPPKHQHHPPGRGQGTVGALGRTAKNFH